MPKFRKKPVVIEAQQWFPEKDIAGVITRVKPRPDMDEPFGYIDTLEGRMTVTSGDWIITGVKGEKYPCKPDIFKATYEPVED